MNTTREVHGNKVIVTTETDRYVDWDEIKGHSECDDWPETPWENADGWDHTFEEYSYRSHDDTKYSYKHIKNTHYSNRGFIEVSNDDIIKWGCVGATGCSKQVRFEAIARAKREATEQLVKWYEDGWYVNVAFAVWGDYSDNVGGIYGDDCDEMIEECRHNVADQMERDGYIVEGRPEPAIYSRVDAYRDKIKRNLGGKP